MRSVLSAVAVACVAIMLTAAPALAQTYPPSEPTAGINDTSVAAGASATITGDHWCPDSTVTLTLQPGDISLGTATVASDGSFSTQVTIPDNLDAGSYTIVVAGLKDDCSTPGSVRISIRVSAGGGVAFTGARVSQGLVLLIVLLVVGALALVVGRRRAVRAR